MQPNVEGRNKSVNLKLRIIKPAAKKIEALPLSKRRLFEFIVDLILPSRSFVDWLRLRKLHKLGAESKNRMDKNSGWAKLEFDKETTNRFTNIAKEVRDNFLKLEDKQINKKEYLQQIANVETVATNYPSILEFALEHSLLQTIGNYLGKFPILHDISVFYSPPQKFDESTFKWQGSQLFHRDGGGTRCFKLWLLCDPVDIQNGPTTLLPSKISDEICQKLKYVPGKKFETDEPLKEYLSETVSLIGPAGTWFATDTDRCLHFGSRTTDSSSRLVMMFHYVDRNSVYYLPLIRRNYKRKRELDLTKANLDKLSLAALR